MRIIASVTPNKTKFGPLLFPGNLDLAVRELAENGYDGIELSLRTPGDVDREDLMRLLERYELSLVSIATGQSYLEDGYSLYAEDEAAREKAVERLKAFVDFIAPCGGGSVILGGIKGTLGSDVDGSVRKAGDETIDRLLKFAEKKRVTLLLEALNRYETNLFNTVEQCSSFAAARESEYLKILPDTFHMNIEEVSMEDSLNASAPYVGALHCADSNRLAPGMGHIDFKPLISAACSMQSIRYIGIEVLPLPDSSISAKTAMQTIKTVMSKLGGVQ